MDAAAQSDEEGPISATSPTAAWCYPDDPASRPSGAEGGRVVDVADARDAPAADREVFRNPEGPDRIHVHVVEQQRLAGIAEFDEDADVLGAGSKAFTACRNSSLLA
jgi:hypothetical protein